MSGEVTYAEIKFQDSSKTENVQNFEQVGVKAPPAPSHIWHKRDVVLILLCLLLLIGLVVLGSIFHLTLKIEVEKLEKLKNVKEELQKNISLQLMYNMESVKKISNFSITLQEMATKLCYELYRKNPEHKCKPCPEKWKWHEDTCYSGTLFQNWQTWQESVMTCSAHNATLLRIKNKSVLAFIKILRLYDYWLGLSPRKYVIGYKNLDETIISSGWFTGNTSDSNIGMYCGYLANTNYVYYDFCTYQHKPVCEKLANPVKIESTLINEEPDGRV